MLAELALAKPDDLLAQIGYGKLLPRLVLDKIVPQDQLKEQAPEHPVVSAVRRVLRGGSDPIASRSVAPTM